jgi:hypothetical protein
MGALSSGGIFVFLGAAFGAAITMLGSIWVLNHRAWKRTSRDKANLLAFLAMLEGRLQFASSDGDRAAFAASRDVAGLTERCALVLEMADLLDTPAVAEAADGFRQVYLLHRLRRALKLWSPRFAPYADMPPADFYLLTEHEVFEEAVAKLAIPAALIRDALCRYIAGLDGRDAPPEQIDAAALRN